VIVAGGLMLGRGLPFDVTVHLQMSAAALDRHTAAEQRWMLAAYARYERENDPSGADVLVRADHPERPALVR
jgi:hypothetical protein